MSDEPEVHSGIPSPDDSGSSGKQVSDPNVELLPAKWQGGSPVSDTVDGLVADKSRIFGSEATSALLAASLRQAENDKRRLESRNDDLTDKLESYRDDLENERLANGKLQGKIDTQGAYKKLRRTCVILAGLFVATGVGLSQAEQQGFAIGAYFAGILLLVVSWFTESKKADK